MKKKGFTLIELIAVLVIVVIIFLSATVLVKSIIEKSRIAGRKRNVDAYGRAVELAASEFLLDNGVKANDINSLNIKYSGSEVSCDVQVVYQNNVFLSKCSVDGILVKDKKSMDGYYQYGDIITFGNIYSDAIKKAIWRYKLQHDNEVPNSMNELEINLDNLDFSCSRKKINSDDSYYLSKCNLAGIEVLSNNTKDGYYHWGNEKYYIGDVVKYKGMDFYVIENSDDTTDTIHLLKKEPIKNSEMEDKLVNIGLQDKIQIDSGSLYLASNYCYGDNCTYDYNSSDVKKIVDLWGETYLDLDDLVDDSDGDKIRIPNRHDTMDRLKYVYTYFGGTSYGYKITAFKDNFKGFQGIWSSTRIYDSDNYVTCMNGLTLYTAPITKEVSNYNLYYISPVINIKKLAIDN